MTQSLTSRLLRRLGHADVFGHGREDEEDEGGDGGDEDEEPEEERVEHARHLLPLVDGDPLGLGPLVGLQHCSQVVQDLPLDLRRRHLPPDPSSSCSYPSSSSSSSTSSSRVAPSPPVPKVAEVVGVQVASAGLPHVRAATSPHHRVPDETVEAQVRHVALPAVLRLLAVNAAARVLLRHAPHLVQPAVHAGGGGRGAGGVAVAVAVAVAVTVAAAGGREAGAPAVRSTALAQVAEAHAHDAGSSARQESDQAGRPVQHRAAVVAVEDEDRQRHRQRAHGHDHRQVNTCPHTEGKQRYRALIAMFTVR